MTLLEIFLIGIGLSMDAFAVAICKGLAMPDKVHKRSAFLIALYFGVFQAVMPTLGWLLGSQFAHYVTRFAPWIAFVLLAWIGGNMIRESRAEEEEDEQPSDGQVKHKELLVLAVAVIGGGTGWYFKIYRPKKQQAADAAEDYGDDYDDTPPWEDEDETESEGEE